MNGGDYDMFKGLETAVKGYDIVYPNGTKKAVTLRFDDGPEGDRKMVELLNKNELKATFYLTISKLNHGGFVTSDEVKTLYNRYEVANHTYSHKDPRSEKLTSQQVQDELQKGKDALEMLTGKIVFGYGYVCSTYGDIGEEEYKKLLSKTGHEYATMAWENGGFTPYITDRFAVGDSFRFSDIRLLDKAKEYCDENAQNLSIFFAMAHTYEFDDKNTPYGWNTVEDFFEIIAGHDDMWYATNGEVISYLLSVYKFIGDNKNSDTIINTTGNTIYLSKDSKVISLPHGETLHI